MPHFVYILECSDGTFYTGYTIDPKKRENEHNQSDKGAKYTKGRRPVKLVYCESHPSESDAKKREYAIKLLGHPQKRRLINS